MAKTRRKPTTRRPAVLVNGHALSGGQELIWRMANEDIGSGVISRMKRGLAALRTLEGDLLLKDDAASVRRGLEESVALERARGEKMELSRRPEGFNRVRIRTRDGLETLERAGAITALQYRAGMLYRDLYEATDPERDLRSHMEGLERMGRGGGEAAAEAWAERRMRLARSVAIIEARVRLADRNDRAVRALREVAGHARCIGAVVSGGGGQATYKRALIVALDVCAAHFGLS